MSFPGCLKRRRASAAWVAGATAVMMGLVSSACGADNSSAGSTTAVSGSSSSPSPEPESAPEFAAQLRPALMAKMEELRVPGAIVLVDVPGQGQWLAALGVGDLAVKTPMRTDDQVRIGSITKTMTASIVLQLVDEGRVSLDDPVAKFVPEVPNGAAITVRQLLNMTSGLMSYTADEEFNREADAHPDTVWTSAELLAAAFRHPPVFPPGQQFDYSNTNYVLLGVIAERITGQDLPRLFKERLFDRLGMTHSRFPAPADASLPRPYAHGYDFVTLTGLDQLEKAAAAGNTETKVMASPGAMPADVTTFNPSFASAAGAVISTAADMKIWAKEMATGSLLEPDTQRQRLDFEAGRYGLGVGQSWPGAVGHAGSVPGYQSVAVYVPDKRASIFVVANLQVAPDVPFTEALPAIALTKLIQERLFQ
jgi:D-alanyl-D-alanine carboxypeptidase